MSDFLQELQAWVTGNLVYHNVGIDPLELINDCEVPGDWVKGAAALTPVLNNVDFLHGSGSLDIGKDGSSTEASYRLPAGFFSPILDLTDKSEFMGLYVKDKTELRSSGDAVQIILQSPGPSDNYQFILTQSELTDLDSDGLPWNNIGGLIPDDWNVVGTPDSANFRFIFWRFFTTNAADTVPIGNLKIDIVRLAKNSWETVPDGCCTLFPVIDTADFIQGGASWKGGNGASGQSSIGYKVLLSDPINMQSMNAGIFAKLADTTQFNAASAMQISFGNDDINNVYTKSVLASVFTNDEWIRIGDLLTDMVLTGSVDTKAINFIQVEWNLLNTGIVIPLGDIKFDYPNYAPAVSLDSSSVFYGYMPETKQAPVSAIALYNLSGSTGKTYPIDKQIIRVLARGNERSDAKDLADQLYKLVHLGNGSALSGLTLTDFYVYNLIARSRPQQAGIDKNSNKLYTFDIEANIREN